MTPPHWIPGQLLDLKRFEDSQHNITYRATLLGEDWDPKGKQPKAEWEADNAVWFDSSHEAQLFISNWYLRPQQQVA